MNKIDHSILLRIQADASKPLAQLAEEVGLSPSACHRRIKLLEAAGVVTGYGARLDRELLGLKMLLFVSISLVSQAAETLEAFEKAVRGVPEVVACHLLAGRADYIMQLAVADMSEFERIHREKLARLPGVATMNTSFCLRTVKPFRGFPIGGVIA